MAIPVSSALFFISEQLRHKIHSFLALFYLLFIVHLPKALIEGVHGKRPLVRSDIWKIARFS